MDQENYTALKRLVPLGLGQIYLFVMTTIGLVDLFQVVLFNAVEIELGEVMSLLLFSTTIHMAIRRFVELLFTTVMVVVLTFPLFLFLHGTKKDPVVEGISLASVGHVVLVGSIYLVMRLGTAYKLAAASGDASRYWFADVVMSKDVTLTILLLWVFMTGFVFTTFLNDGAGSLASNRLMASIIMLFMVTTRLLLTWVVSRYTTLENVKKAYNKFMDPDAISA